MSNPKTIFLVLTCAMAIAGEVVRANTLVEVTIEEGRDFLTRGKARLATAKEQEGAAPEAVKYPDEATARAESIATAQDNVGSPLIDTATTAIEAGEVTVQVDTPRPDFEAVAPFTPASVASATVESPAKRARAHSASKPA